MGLPENQKASRSSKLSLAQGLSSKELNSTTISGYLLQTKSIWVEVGHGLEEDH
jgi:hypothetical protein